MINDYELTEDGKLTLFLLKGDQWKRKIKK